MACGVLQYLGNISLAHWIPMPVYLILSVRAFPQMFHLWGALRMRLIFKHSCKQFYARIRSCIHATLYNPQKQVDHLFKYSATMYIGVSPRAPRVGLLGWY